MLSWQTSRSSNMEEQTICLHYCLCVSQQTLLHPHREVQRALSWQPWASSWEEQAVVAARSPRALLRLIRAAAGAFLLEAAAAGHVLGVAASALVTQPGDDSGGPAHQGMVGIVAAGVPAAAAAAAAAPLRSAQVSALLECSALQSVLRLMLGVEPRLRATALAALSAQMGFTPLTAAEVSPMTYPASGPSEQGAGSGTSRPALTGGTLGGGREGTGEETQQTPLQATERRQPPQQDRELAVLRTLLAVPELMEQLLLAFERGLVEVRARGLEQVKGREGATGGGPAAWPKF